jgi:uncharacterized membrane protein (DUF106 family)
MNKDINKEEINEFIENNHEKEINILLDKFENEDHISWDDLDDNISPKLWGEAIQKRVLEPTNKRRYKIQNIDYIKNKISIDGEDKIESQKDESNIKSDNSVEEDNINEENEIKSDDTEEDDSIELPEIDISSAKWSWKDKGMALFTFTVIMGSTYDPIQSVVYSILNPIFGILVDLMPFYMVIFVLAALTSMLSTYVREYYLDSSKSNDFKKHILDLRGDSVLSLPDDATPKEEDKLMRLQSAMMKSKFKPFVWILSVTIPVLLWIFTVTSVVGVGETIIFPILGEYTWSSSIFLSFQAYIFWYILCSVIANQIIKRVFVLIFE